MKTPEEYFQEQVFDVEEGPRDLTDAERRFFKKYMGMDPGASDGEKVEPTPMPAEAEVQTVVPGPKREPEKPKTPVSAPRTSPPASRPEEKTGESMAAQLRREEEIQLVSFFLNQQEYALPIATIQEVIKYMEPTKLPAAPDFMAGIINLRGRVTPLISLTSLLHLAEDKEAGFIVVCRHQGLQIGLLVHAVATMYRVGQEKIEWNIETHLGVNAEFLSGLIKSGENLVGIVAIDQVVKKVLK